ncbi:MAG TPA: hypothetical protein PKX15_03125 [Bacteroidales bacterium]|nr:hypothetical protein [Bacteroidales bacterium]
MSDNIISISKPSAANPTPSAQKPEQMFPTEVINLPTKGWFYPVDNPLSSGKIELKMMTAKEEDILTSKNLIQKNLVLDKLLESVIIDKRINPDDLFTGDRNAIFFAIRRLAYGDEYEAVVTCGRCTQESNVTIDLSKIDNRPFDFEKYPQGINSFEFVLPTSKVNVTFKLLNKRDENAIEAELKGLSKVSKDLSREITTRLSYIITSVNGNSERTAIRKFVNESLLSKDSLALRSHIRNEMPDIDSEFDFTCVHCGLERREETPMGVSFFWPDR